APSLSSALAPSELYPLSLHDALPIWAVLDGAPMNALQAAILRKARESCALKEAFFSENAARIEACAAAMKEAFARGGRLFAFGNGGSACDAQHVSVEFMHPIFEKRAPLPAIALPCDTALITAKGND